MADLIPVYVPPYIDPYHLRQQWLAGLSKQEQKPIRDFFKLPDFYIKYGDSGLHVGTCHESGEDSFLLPLERAEMIRLELEALLGVQLPRPHELSPAIIRLRYTDLQPVVVHDEDEYYSIAAYLREQVDSLRKKAKLEAKLRIQQAELQPLREQLRYVRDLLQPDARRPVVAVAIDFEWYERNPNKILELGWSVWSSYSRLHRTCHWIVEEHAAVRNKSYVPNNKWKFGFGTSITGPLQQGTAALKDDLQAAALQAAAAAHAARDLHGPEGQEQEQQPVEAAAAAEATCPAAKVAAGAPEATSSAAVAAAAATSAVEQPVVLLVGHSMTNDLQVMARLGVKLPPNIIKVDTEELHRASTWTLGAPRPQPVSLKNLMAKLDIEASEELHNAGNDARYTMEVFIALCEAAVVTAEAAEAAEATEATTAMEEDADQSG